MKIYLILLAISFISAIIVTIDIRCYIKKNYKRIKKHSFIERFNAILKNIILLFMILPYIINLLYNLFNHDAYIIIIEESVDSEHWEKI